MTPYADRDVEVRDRLLEMRRRINAALRELDKPRKAAIRYPNAHGHLLPVVHVHGPRVDELLYAMAGEAITGNLKA